MLIIHKECVERIVCINSQLFSFFVIFLLVVLLHSIHLELSFGDCEHLYLEIWRQYIYLLNSFVPFRAEILLSDTIFWPTTDSQSPNFEAG